MRTNQGRRLRSPTSSKGVVEAGLNETEGKLVEVQVNLDETREDLQATREENVALKNRMDSLEENYSNL